MIVDEIIYIKRLVQYLVYGNCPTPQGKQNSSIILTEDLAYHYNPLPLRKIVRRKISGISYHSSYSLKSHPTHPNRLLGIYI